MQNLLVSSFCFILVLLLSSAGAQEKDKTPLDQLRMVEGDEQGNEIKALKTELLISESEENAIAQIQRLIKRHKGSSLEPDLQFRLAELYMRRSKTDRFFEIHRESETVVSLVPRIVKQASSRRSIQQAIDNYEMIQKRFPNFSRMDLVLFNNAFARQNIGQSKTAEDIYWSLIKKYPDSDLVPDSHLAIGELSFERKDFKHALEHFLAVEKYPETRVYPYGLYKAGWTYYNLRQAELGIKKLEQVVAFGHRVASQGLDSRLDLRKEALGDMTLFFGEVYVAINAFSYFEKHARELDVEPYMLKLSKLYERHSRWNDREVVLREVLAKRSKSPLVPEIHNELVWNYEQMKDKTKAVLQMQAFDRECENKRYQVVVEKNKKPDPNALPLADCRGTLRETSLKLASRWLKTWKKNKGFPEFADTAEQAFEIYLKGNNSGEEAAEARFAYAELLFQREKFRKASKEYALVNQMGEVPKKLAHDANYAAMLSLEKAVGDKWSDADVASFHDLAKLYVSQNPQGEYLLDVEFKVGLLAYEKGRFDEAAPIFLRLGADYAKHEKGQKAQDLYLDILNSKKDYKGLKEYAAILIPKETKTERKVKLSGIYQQAYFLEVQNLEEKKKYAEALKGYRKFSDENPGSQLAEKALWNSFQLHFRINDLSGGAQTGLVFFQRYPKSPQAKDALLKSAQTFENMGLPGEAASAVEHLMALDPKELIKWKLLAADFASLSSQVGKAKRLYGEVRAQGNEKQKSEALQKILEIEKQRPDSESYRKLMAELVNAGVQPHASLSQLDLVERLFQQKNYERAFIESKKVLNMDGQASSYAKARARFIQARILEDEFINQSVKAKLDRIGIVLAIKTEKLEKAQSAYQSVIKMGDPKVAVESLQRLSRLYTHYVSSLRTMPMPESLTAQDQEVFKGEMERLSIPLEEKGVDTMAQALAMAKKFNLRDGTIAEVQHELRQLNMQPQPEITLSVGQPGISLPVPQGVGS